VLRPLSLKQLNTLLYRLESWIRAQPLSVMCAAFGKIGTCHSPNADLFNTSIQSRIYFRKLVGFKSKGIFQGLRLGFAFNGHHGIYNKVTTAAQSALCFDLSIGLGPSRFLLSRKVRRTTEDEAAPNAGRHFIGCGWCLSVPVSSLAQSRLT
jgi:hypothetical protein